MGTVIVFMPSSESYEGMQRGRGRRLKLGQGARLASCQPSRVD